MVDYVVTLLGTIVVTVWTQGSQVTDVKLISTNVRESIHALMEVGSCKINLFCFKEFT